MSDVLDSVELVCIFLVLLFYFLVFLDWLWKCIKRRMELNRDGEWIRDHVEREYEIVREESERCQSQGHFETSSPRGEHRQEDHHDQPPPYVIAVQQTQKENESPPPSIFNGNK